MSKSMIKNDFIIGFEREKSDCSPFEGKVTIKDLINIMDDIDLKGELKIPLASISHMLTDGEGGVTYIPSEL